jgi:dipeptidyl aminopeptidase/acylaminoacyl peptidase
MAMAACLSSHAIEIQKIRISSLIPVSVPILTDTTDVNGKKIETEELLYASPQSLKLWQNGTENTTGILPAPQQTSLLQAGFTLQNTGFVKADFKVECKSRHTLYIDDSEVQGSTQLVPGTHHIVVKLLQKKDEADTLKISLSSEQDKYICINPEGKRYWTLKDLMNGKRLRGVSLSSAGKYMMQKFGTTFEDGHSEDSQQILEVATGNILSAQNFSHWDKTGDRYIRYHQTTDGAWQTLSVDLKTGDTKVLSTYKGRGSAQYIGNNKLLITENVDGPKETNNDVHQILEPDDRQPGWRNRSNIYIQDIATGVTRQLTAGQRNVYAHASDDGSKLLLTIYTYDVTERPFNFTTVLLVDTETLQADTIVKHDGFLHGSSFSFDGKYITFLGSPEAFNGIGNTLSADKIPSLYEYELFLYDIASKQVKCLTRNFDPSIINTAWSKSDGCIYALAENKDFQSLYRINPQDGKITFIKTTDSFVYNNFSIAREKPVMAYVSETTQTSDRSWIMDLKTGKERLAFDINPERTADIQLGECHSWNFRAERGDSIYGCYYLPPYFDETKQYPMIVYYYGGCSPVGRYLDSYYCYQEWAALGYVVYVIQPSGCSGFGQEFASRHSNAYGDYTADDIIQGTKQFCKEHPYVNDKKIGCMGASYGGFMTMYLQTQTDIFAAAMSHAGISNPASYWGYGYWGYSYSATSAAHSYPWNNTELYSGHAPLFNADKVHTPILFMHGSADTNVPINESIQMFTALKILGRETAFITVEGENHHILDYKKRIRWHDSIMAWFARWLQDDPTWWNTMYPAKNI